MKSALNRSSKRKIEIHLSKSFVQQVTVNNKIGMRFIQKYQLLCSSVNETTSR